MGRTGEPGHVRQQALSRPALVRETLDSFDEQVHRILSKEDALSISQVYGFGCGDSHNAAATTQMAFQQWAGLPMSGTSAMQFSRYTTPWLGSRGAGRALAIGISVSGEVARTVEGVLLAREAGALTMGITCTTDSRLTRGAHLSLDVTIPNMDIPRVRTYIATQVALYLVALRLGELRGTVSAARGKEIRAQMRQAADIAEATQQAVSKRVRTLAAELKAQQHFVYLGAGPNLGTAMYGAAKVLEAAGTHAQGQDTEEWVHLQRFVKEPRTPTFLLAPPSIAYSRAVEVARVIQKTGYHLIALVDEGEKEIAGTADVVLPVAGHLPEALTPLTYAGTLEVFASDLAEAMGEPYFRGFEGRWATPSGDPIWFSEIVEHRKLLALED